MSARCQPLFLRMPIKKVEFYLVHHSERLAKNRLNTLLFSFVFLLDGFVFILFFLYKLILLKILVQTSFWKSQIRPCFSYLNSK